MKLSEYIKEFGDKQVDVDKLSEFIIEDKVFAPKENEEYYLVNCFGDVGYYNNNHQADKKIFRTQQVYRTRAEAEFARDKAIFLEFMRKEFLRNSDELDWKDDNQTKWEICYNHAHKLIKLNTVWGIQRTGLFTTSRKWLRYFTEKYEDEIKKYYFEVNDDD